MGSHFALFLFLSLSSTGFAQSTPAPAPAAPASGLTISLTGSNASNALPSAVTGGGPSFYYSNPSGTNDGTNWTAGATGANGSCAGLPILVNPNCRDSTSLFTFQTASTVATSGTAMMYGYYIPGGVQPPAGTLISGMGTKLFQFPYTANVVTGPANLHFGDICSLVSSSLPVSPACIATDPTTPLQIQIFLIADANGDGTFESGEGILQFSLWIQSQIPVNSSISLQSGLYGFQTFPDDGKVFIKPEQYQQGTGVSGGSAINFYYVTGPDIYTGPFDPTTFPKINVELQEPAASIPFQQIPLNSDGTLTSNYITSLNNGTSYYFRASVVDAAGNLGYMTPTTDDTPPSPPLPFQWHAAKPEQIVGLLSKNGECFIATAAYGTPMAKQVQILREFRDKILVKSYVGQRFVYWYYKNGNALADKIRNRDGVRALVRTLLYPVIGYGWLALKIGAFNATLFISTLLMLPLLIIQLRRSRKILENIS